MITFNLYAAGTRSPETLLANFPDFPSARAAWDQSQGGDSPAWAIVPVGEAGELESLGSLCSINPGYSSGMYVISCGGGVSCLGFDYADKKTRQVAAWLEAQGVPIKAATGEPGTPEAYAAYLATMAAGAAHNAATGARCPAELIPELIGLEGKRVEVTDCYGETRRFIVGKSTGWLPIHLEIESRRASGGGSVTGAPFKRLQIVEGGR